MPAKPAPGDPQPAAEQPAEEFATGGLVPMSTAVVILPAGEVIAPFGDQLAAAEQANYARAHQPNPIVEPEE